MIRTHYQVLGVPPTAPPELIQQAYRRLILRAACSAGPDAHAAREEYRSARDAFAVLMDPERRAVYDFSILGLRPGQGRSAQRTAPVACHGA